MQSTEVTIKLGGMVCRACAQTIEENLLQIRGVIAAEVSYWKSEARVEYDPELTNEDAIKQSIERTGYRASSDGMSGFAVDALCLLLTALLIWLLVGSGANPVPDMIKSGMSLGYIFLLGLISSTHCVCMCGGIMLSQTADVSTLQADRKKRVRGLKASLSYNLGRVLSYTLIGALFGLLGTAISYGSDFKSIVFTMAGLAVALIGLNMWGLIPGLRALAPRQSKICALPVKARCGLAGRPLAVGLLTGLMPCGPLYAMWVYAVGCGGALMGAASMLMFALGSLPLMFLFGALNSFIPAKLTKYANRLSSMLVLAMGAQMLIKGLRMGGFM